MRLCKYLVAAAAFAICVAGLVTVAYAGTDGEKSKDRRCDAGYEYFEGNCYRLHKPANYEFALVICKGEEAHLPSIHNDTVNNYIASHGEDILIGLRIIHENFTAILDGNEPEVGEQTSNLIRWSDGTDVDYLNNAEALSQWQPFLGKCVSVSPNGVWNNVHCGLDSLHFLCRKEAKPRCLEEYSRFGLNCYRNYDIQKTFDEAEATCIDDGGHLASVNDDETARFLLTFKYVSFWVGFKDGRWTDGSHAKYITDKIRRRNSRHASDSGRGFYGEYEMFKDNNGKPVFVPRAALSENPFICQRPAWFDVNNACPQDNTFAGPVTVYSPGYPKRYHGEEGLMNCTYYFATEKGEEAGIEFSEVNLAEDYILVFEGWEPSNRSPIGIITHNNHQPGTRLKTVKSNLISFVFIGRHSGKWKAHFLSAKGSPRKTHVFARAVGTDNRPAIHTTTEPPTTTENPILCDTERPVTWDEEVTASDSIAKGNAAKRSVEVA